MKTKLTTAFSLLLSLSLFGQSAVFFDETAYQTALEEIKTAQTQSTAADLTDAYSVVLHYHRRRCDPDSVLLAARHLSERAPFASEAGLSAAYSVLESHLSLDRIPEYRALFTEFKEKEKTLPSELKPLAEFYRMVAEGKYENTFGNNFEKASLYFYYALENIDLQPSLRREIMTENFFALRELGQYELLKEHFTLYKKIFKARQRDALDVLLYDYDAACVSYMFERYAPALAQQKKVLRQVLPYADRLPYLVSAVYKKMSDAQYYIERNADCKEYIETALRYKKYAVYLHRYIAVLYHLGEYDAALAECAKIIGDTELSGNVSVVYFTVDNAFIAALFWQSRILYKKSIEADREAAEAMLRHSLRGADFARKLVNQGFFVIDGYNMSQYTYNNRIAVICGYQRRASYQLALRTGDPADLRAHFRYIEQGKNFLLTEAFSLDRLPEDKRAMKIEQIRKYEEAQFDFLTGDRTDAGNQLAQILAESRHLDTLIAELKKSHPNPIQDHGDLTYADPDVLQAGLDEESVLIVYFNQWQHLYVYVITAQKQFVRKLRADHDRETKIEKLLKTLKSPLHAQSVKRDKFIKQSHELYQTLLQPLENEIAGKQHLIIVPERDLCFLPFEILLKTDDKKNYSELDYLLKDYKISYHYSTTLYQKTRARPAVADGSYLGFAPVFVDKSLDFSSSERTMKLFSRKKNRSLRSGRFTPLPGTETEIVTVVEMLPAAEKSTVLLKKAATVENLTAQMQKPYQYLHIATHGMMNYYDPRLSAFACYAGNDGNADLIHAHEIQELNLQTELAVLSSCESGVGRLLEGENIIGLSRSFLAAGAKNILYSLWKIDDENSSRLMIDFYRRHLKEGQFYTAALRGAKLGLLRNERTAAPRFWAAFVLMGE